MSLRLKSRGFPSAFAAAHAGAAFELGVRSVLGLVIEGDSLMSGFQTNATIAARFSLLASKAATSRATSGDTLSNMSAGYSTDVAPFYAPASTNAVLIEGGTNDIQGGATLANLQTYIQAISAAAKATGFLVAVATIPARGDVSWTGPMETIRGNYNTWLRSNYQFFATYLADIAAIPELSNPANTAYFASDALHWTNVSNDIVADYIRGVLGVSTVANAVADFSGAWATNAGTLALAGGVTAPVGVAYTLTEDTATDAHYTGSPAVPILKSASYSMSLVAKAITGQWLQLGSNGAIGGPFANFDVLNGSLGSANGTPSIQSLGNGWFKCILSFIASSEAFGANMFVSSISASNQTLITSIPGTSRSYYVASPSLSRP